MPKPPAAGEKYEKKYSKEDVQQALDAIKDGMSKKEASRRFGVPRATLQYRSKCEVTDPKPGPPTALTASEEKDLEDWIIHSSKKGFPQRKENVLHSVEQFLQKNPRETPFINNKPGEGWYKLFLKRHPNIASRTAEAVTSASANVSEQNIRQWFKQIEATLKEEQLFEILDDPTRIFNGDETGFQLCPKQGKVLAERGARDVYEVDMAPAKSSITVMFTFSASGAITPPTVIYPLKKMRAEIYNSIPRHWGASPSENGWMTKELFYKYIVNVLYPYLVAEKVTFPIILFVDGHKSHMNYDLSMKCKELGIVLIALYPNATRILQPADVAAFRPIKNGWRKALLDWRQKNVTKQLTKVDFGYVLQIVVEKYISARVIKNGFRACGLYPFNPDAIKYTKCIGKKQPTTNENAVPVSVLGKFLTMADFHELVDSNTLNRLENEIPDPENGFHRGLSNIYKFLKDDSSTGNDNNISITEPQQQHVRSPARDVELKNKITPQEQLLVQDTWFDINDIPVIVCQTADQQDICENGAAAKKNTSENQKALQDINSGISNIDEILANDIENDILIEYHDILDTGKESPLVVGKHENSYNNAFIENISTPQLSENIKNIHCKDHSVLETPLVKIGSQDKDISQIISDAKSQEKDNTQIKSFLDMPPTPARKKKKLNLSSPLYLLTGNKWLERERLKLEEKEKAKEEKEKKKRLREEAKQLKIAQKQENANKRKKNKGKIKIINSKSNISDEPGNVKVSNKIKSNNNKKVNEKLNETSFEPEKVSKEKNTLNKTDTLIKIKTKEEENLQTKETELTKKCESPISAKEKETERIQINFPSVSLCKTKEEEQLLTRNTVLTKNYDFTISANKNETDRIKNISSGKKINIISTVNILPAELKKIKKQLFLDTECNTKTKTDLKKTNTSLIIEKPQDTIFIKTKANKTAEFNRETPNRNASERLLNTNKPGELNVIYREPGRINKTEIISKVKKIKTEAGQNNDKYETALLNTSKKRKLDDCYDLEPDDLHLQSLKTKHVLERRANFARVLERRATFRNEKEIEDFINNT